MKFEINVKFDIGDTVYLLHENQVITAKVAHIYIKKDKISVNKGKGFIIETNIFYAMEYSNKPNLVYNVFEDKLFATKEELLNSL